MGFSISAEAVYAIIAAAGTATSVYASVEAGQEKKDEADYNARVQQNQALEDQDAAQAEAERIRKAARTQASSADAQLAASGVKVGEGTSLDINRTIYQNSEEDAYNAILSGGRASKAANEQADLLTAQGKNAANDSYIGAGATILGSAAGVAKGWKTSGTPKSGDGGYSDLALSNTRRRTYTGAENSYGGL